VSFRPRPKQRDKAEKAIVEALRAAGASVHLLDDDRRSGLPDLLVGYKGRTMLLEVKNPADRSNPYRVKSGEVRETTRIATDLSDGQERWHRAWRGQRPVVVRTPAEALVELERSKTTAWGDVMDPPLPPHQGKDLSAGPA
jgi:Holliday junction resolvase